MIPRNFSERFLTGCTSQKADCLIKTTERLIKDPGAFTWPLEDPLACVAIAWLELVALRWADVVSEKYGLDDEDEPEPADWWKES